LSFPSWQSEHVPPAVQTLNSPAQRSSTSNPAATRAHAPDPRVHVSHVPSQGTPQQTPFSQFPLAQSSSDSHARPCAHATHSDPPQSTSDSWPSSLPLVHSPGKHTFSSGLLGLGAHRRLLQSLETRHVFPSSQRSHPSLPPQSTSVSPDSRSPFTRQRTHDPLPSHWSPPVHGLEPIRSFTTEHFPSVQIARWHPLSIVTHERSSVHSMVRATPPPEEFPPLEGLPPRPLSGTSLAPPVPPGSKR
jgi:hypothetical protein